jgi:hypothetical protein
MIIHRKSLEFIAGYYDDFSKNENGLIEFIDSNRRDNTILVDVVYVEYSDNIFQQQCLACSSILNDPYPVIIWISPAL